MAVVAPAPTSAAASGSTCRVASARSTPSTTSTTPTATQGSGRSPRFSGTHHVAKASAAIHGTPRRRPARPEAGQQQP